MGAHVYWRLNITANNGDSYYVSISEIEMRSTPGGADLCTGGVASASTSESGNSAGRAVDDDGLTSWTTAFFSITGWWRYQFASPVDVVEYAIKQTGISAGRSPKNWTLEYSDDGVAWTVHDTQVGQTGWASTETRTFTLYVPPTETPISGDAAASLTGTASLSLGAQMAGSASAAITGTANLSAGTHLAATGRIEATPRGRLAGAEATPGTGNFFLLF